MAHVIVEIPDKDVELLKEVYDKELLQPLYHNTLYVTKLAQGIIKAVVKGQILPKGHGRITDMDEAIKCIEEVVDSKEKQYALYLIDWACSKRVLIEADKEDEDENNN
ncbi:MAG: hypothetical protein LIR46_07775 [Bacteroidota bacterium]|nr:hypothetical protein [Bacteroidota bacterium]